MAKSTEYKTPNIYQIIAGNHVQQAQEAAYNAKVQSDYEAWQKAQPPQVDDAFMQSVNADYNNWLNAQQAVKMPTLNEIKAETKEIPQDRPKSDLKGSAIENGTLKMYGQKMPTNEELTDYMKNLRIKQIPGLEDLQSQIAAKSVKDDTVASLDESVQNYQLANQWLDPNYKMSKEEQSKAKKIAKTELAKLKSIKNPTETDKDRINLYKSLQTKASPLQSFALGAGQNAIRTLQNIGNVILTANQANAPTSQALDIQKQNVADYRNKVNQWNEDHPAAQNAQTQSPIAYGAGQMAEKLGEYALTNPAFNKLGSAIGGTSKVAQLAANQAGENAQDLVIDTLPLFMNIVEDPTMSNDEKASVIAKDIGLNALGNLAAYGVFNYVAPELGKKLSQLLADTNASTLARQAEQEAFNQNISQGANWLKYVNDNNITGLEPKATQLPELNIDPTTANNNQLRSLMDEYNNTFKDTSAMRDIFSPEDLDNATNSQFNELMKGRPQPLTAEDIPEIKMEPDIELDDYTKMWDSGNIIPNFAENAQKTASDVEIPQIKSRTLKPEELMSDEAAEIEAAISSDLSEMAKSMDEFEVSGYFDNIDNPKAKEAFKRVKNAYSDYAIKLTETSNQEVLDKSAKELISARKQLSRALKATDPEAAKVFDNYHDNMLIKHPIEKAQSPAWQKYKGEYQPIDVVGEVEGTGIKADNSADMNLQTFAGDGSGADPNWKLSETYTNTGARGGGWTEDELTKYTNPDNYLYDSIDEVRSVEEATKMRLAEGREAFKNRVLYEERISSVELDGLMMEWRELTQEARALEAQGKNADKLWRESNKIFRKVQEQSTDNAQALQALAKWSRNTPEGMLANAENIVNGKVEPPTSELRKMLDKFAKRNKKTVEFSPEFEREFLNEAEKIAGLKGTELDTTEAKQTMARLGRMVNQQIPVKWNEKLTTWLMDNMLGNFRTLITRNAGGNVGLNAMEQTLQRPLAAGIDSALALKTGKRTQAGLSGEAIADYLSGFRKGLADELSDVRTGLHTARSGENTLGNAISSNRRIFKSNLLNLKDQLTRHGLSVGDRPFYESVYKQTLGDYQRLYNRGLMGDEVQKLKPEEFKEYSEVAAHLNALAAVYQQDTVISNALLGFKKDIGNLSRGALGFDILSQFSMPFVKTPANIVERAIDYSPLGFVRNAARTTREVANDAFDQNRFANETARNIIGTGLMAGGVAMAANGGLTGSYSDDKDKKQAQKESGMQEHAWNVPEGIPGIGGKQMDISWVPVLGSNLVASDAAYEAYKNGEGDVIGNLGAGLEAGGQAIFDQSMFQGLQRLFGTGESYDSDKGIVANMGETVKSGLGQFIPSLVRQSAQVIDPYQRDVAYSNKGTSLGFMDNYDINSLANNVPGLREEYLAPKVDTQGNLVKENQGRNVGMKILEDMILPGKLTELQTNKLTEEAERLSEITTNNTAYLPKADRSKVDTEEHILTNDEWVDYQQKYYQTMTKAGTQLIDSKYYKDLKDGAKEEILGNLYSAVRSAINSDYTSKSVDGAAKAYKEAGGGDKGIKSAINYLEGSQIIKEYGVSSSSNAAKEIREAVNNGSPTRAKELAEKNAKMTSVMDKYGLENNSGTQKVYSEYGEQGLKEYSKLGSKGFKAYQSAKSEGMQLPSLDNYSKTYKTIDSNGNGEVTQSELAAYLNSGSYSQAQANEIASLYGDWKKNPKKTNKGWQFK